MFPVLYQPGPTFLLLHLLQYFLQHLQFPTCCCNSVPSPGSVLYCRRFPPLLLSIPVWAESGSIFISPITCSLILFLLRVGTSLRIVSTNNSINPVTSYSGLSQFSVLNAYNVKYSMPNSAAPSTILRTLSTPCK